MKYKAQKQLLTPPQPPQSMSIHTALDPQTDEDTLWEIACFYPHLRPWLIANTRSPITLLEFLGQCSSWDKKLIKPLHVFLESIS